MHALLHFSITRARAEPCLSESNGVDKIERNPTEFSFPKYLVSARLVHHFLR